MEAFLLISFFAGALTVLAPCILPLLPVIVGGSLAGEGSARRALVIVISLGLSVFLFTLILKVSTVFITIPELFWQLFSGGLLILFGVVTIWPVLWDRIGLVNSVYLGSNKLLGFGYQKQNSRGDVLIGAALGPVFSSCSPTYFVILASVLPAHFATGLAYLFAYVLGLCIFLLIIALLGQKAALWLGMASDPRGWFKRGIGVLFVVIGIGIIFGIDKTIEAALPAGTFGEIGIEQQLLSSQSVSATTTSSSSVTNTSSSGGKAAPMSFLTAAEKALRYQKAPELVSPDGYINTNGQAINIAQFKGKDVVLVDFWDYSCINCQRTIPYLNAWYQKYKDQGLVIIGVHTPEFSFEQLQQNVEDATKRFGIRYPVVLDNKYQTWGAYHNEYWPNEYLIDIDGYVVHQHAGEGDYDGTEQAIQQALAERAARLGMKAVATSTLTMPQTDLSDIKSPETYFGSDRNEYLGNGNQGVAGVQQFTLPTSEPEPNTLYLGGSWNIEPQFAEAKAGDTIIFKYSADDVYMVATNPTGRPVRMKVLRDGVPVGNFAGSDVSATTSEAVISGDRLYKVVHDTVPGAHTIEIQIESGTLDAYTFTFG